MCTRPDYNRARQPRRYPGAMADRPALLVDRVSKTFRHAGGAHAHAQGARAAPAPPFAARALRGAERHLVRDRARGVLRDRRSQRQRQEHAAEVPGRDLRRRRGPHLAPRPPVDVHRARRRLQPGPRRSRQRGDERHHARAQPARGALPLRASSSSRNSRSSRTSSSRTTPPGCTSGSRSRWRSRWTPTSC